MDCFANPGRKGDVCGMSRDKFPHLGRDKVPHLGRRRQSSQPLASPRGGGGVHKEVGVCIALLPSNPALDCRCIRSSSFDARISVHLLHPHKKIDIDMQGAEQLVSYGEHISASCLQIFVRFGQKRVRAVRFTFKHSIACFD